MLADCFVSVPIVHLWLGEGGGGGRGRFGLQFQFRVMLALVIIAPSSCRHEGSAGGSHRTVMAHFEGWILYVNFQIQLGEVEQNLCIPLPPPPPPSSKFASLHSWLLWALALLWRGRCLLGPYATRHLTPVVWHSIWWLFSCTVGLTIILTHGGTFIHLQLFWAWLLRDQTAPYKYANRFLSISSSQAKVFTAKTWIHRHSSHWPLQQNTSQAIVFGSSRKPLPARKDHLLVFFLTFSFLWKYSRYRRMFKSGGVAYFERKHLSTFF